MSDQEYRKIMSNFRQKQSTTFTKANLVMVCGKLVEGERLTHASEHQLLDFLKKASLQPEEIKSGISSKLSRGSGHAPETAAPRTGHPKDAHLEDPYAGTRHTSGRALAASRRTPTPDLLQPSNYQHPTSSAHPERVVTSPTHSTQRSASLHNRPVALSICTSAYEHKVKGLMSWITKLRDNHSNLISKVRFRKLPYNDIDSFKFPPNDPVDVMVLCHSVRNRGFSITDVMKAIYDKYLKYCFKEFGEKKMAVIVHDIIGWNPAVVPGQMDTFKKTQPTTFKLVDTVIICGSLENPDKLEMREEDIEKLFSLIETASKKTHDKAQVNQDGSGVLKLEQGGKSDEPFTPNSGEIPKISNKEVDAQQPTAIKGPRANPLSESKVNTGREDARRSPTTEDPNAGSKQQKGKEGPSAKKGEESSQEEKVEEKRRAKKNEDNEAKANKEGAKGEDEIKQQPLIRERPVSISLCTSAHGFNVEGLVSYLKDLMKTHPELIKEVKIHQLPYNDLDHYTFPVDDPVDVMILCHSIHNRRFAITDVMDALYDEYLPYCARVIGKAKTGVIVHDFDDMRETVQSSRMSSFKYKQPKAFKTTSLQMTCGTIEKEEQGLKKMQEADKVKLFKFLKNASTYSEKMMDRSREGDLNKGQKILKRIKDKASSCLPRKDTTGGSQAANASTGDTREIPDETNTRPPPDDTVVGQQKPGTSHAAHTQGLTSHQSASQSSARSSIPAQKRSNTTPSDPRRISVSICSSAYEHNVKGLMSWFTAFKAKQPHMIADVRFRELPYNDIDSFKFPPEDAVDVMVLCHSVQNRGFSITNVLNSLYDIYLKYCHEVIGKKKLAVIVHDFKDWKPENVDVKMESFRRRQSLTFELVDTVIICGSLEVPGKIDMRDKDLTELIIFLEKARRQPKQNYTVRESSWMW